MYNLAIISGDGIGQEVMSACEYLLDKLDLEFSFEYGEAGFECFNNNGTTLPEETIRIGININTRRAKSDHKSKEGAERIRKHKADKIL